MKEIKQKSKGSQYKCSQVFGYKGSKEKIHEQDLISVLKFDQEGRHIALGDKAGRVIVFKSNAAKKKEERFSYYTEFQAYNRQFDPLNSNDVDQEILQLLWMRDQGQYQKMLTMNCKNIKLWKIFQRAEKKIVKTVGRQLSFPKFQQVQSSVNSILQKTIQTKFEEELIGMDQTNNEQYIICSDLVKTVLWNLDKSGTPYLVADIQKNKKIQDCKENINCIKAHPTTDSMFAYGTNYGTVVLGDCRISDSCQPLTLKIDFSKEKNNFFSQMISSCSGLAFTNNSRQIVVRDYLSVKLWDLSKTDKPLLSIPVQQSLKTKLCDIFQNNCIFDKFSLSLSRDGATALTGNYNNCFHAIDLEDSTNTQYQVSFKKQTINRPMIPNKCPPITKMDYARKVIASDFHPKSNSFAISSLNCFLIYSM